ncbi:type II toxin-antitoxin system RelE/ParE family toxin [Mucilaginibacter sp.]|jgi:plasmid stabilization system protein ParE|uniref:type II toxin-antitoxin system RelE/ParE family toxin n=1 Tax=Mucilaginibacter sp. TaxID=1882438 RepID=UPI0039C9F675
MAFQIIWTKKASEGYDRIINYLQENWTDREIVNFIAETDRFFEVLAQHPEILQKTLKHKNVYRGPINKLTILTYRVKPKAKQIELINIRGARQRPLRNL